MSSIFNHDHVPVLWYAVRHVDGFDVTSYQSSLRATVGHSHTLSCTYALSLNQSQVELFLVNWLENTPIKSIWQAEYRTSKGITNAAQAGYVTRLTGSSASLQNLLIGHSITFTSIEERDEGQYYCSVQYKLYNQDVLYGGSPFVVVEVIGKV